MLHAVIMAGGSGTRFWPESRAATPKQLLRLSGERTMIQSTVDRLEGLVEEDRVLIVTNQRLVDAICEQLPTLSRQSVLGEPCKRDTAPCIGLAAFVVSREDADATMAVMPADHVIQPDERFQAAIRQAASLVDRENEIDIVTIGIKPTYPAETFGYIQRGMTILGDENEDSPAFQVQRFKEKPDQRTAAKYLASGDFYWNSGIFVWKAETILSALEKHQPQMYQHLKTIAEAWGTADFSAVFEREFQAIEGVSIDYAVMEHAEGVAVIEAPFAWDDVGSWQALSRLHDPDENGNIVIGKHLGIRTSGSIVRTDDDHLVVTLGITDSIIVHTKNATLVANKHDEEAIREVVEKLQQLEETDYL